MKRGTKFAVILAATIILTICTSTRIFAKNEEIEYSEDFKQWLELSDEERQKVMMPRMYDVPYTYIDSKNPLLNARLLKASINTRYSLKDVIPANLIIKNQMQTNSCWTFAALSTLETNLALSNYKRGVQLSKVYDFSERHMEYATSRTFPNDKINKYGYTRNVGDGGIYQFVSSYLTNGSGAIPEAEMPFENNENTVDISEIQNKTVSSQVYETVEFPDYSKATGDEKTEIMNRIKQHIQNYGAVQASIHGTSSDISALSCYNNDTGAKYCSSSYIHKIDHAVSIIGWDDNYSIENFNESSRPKENGAWIVRNSWGDKLEDWKISDLKDEIFTQYKQQCINNGWNSAEEIPNEFLQSAGYTIEGDRAYINYGDNGLIYISYEDANVAKALFGIVKASDTVNYDNLYQYDELYPDHYYNNRSSSAMLCNIFNKNTTGKEYLTQISLYVPETYTCKVYVNPNGTEKNKANLEQVQLKAGESITFDSVGYHTIEFAKPVEISASSFAVMVEIQGTRTALSIPLEVKIEDSSVKYYNNAIIESGKCFIAKGNDINNCEWQDLSTIKESNNNESNGDSTIKAYTTNELLDGSLKSIEITTPPTKTVYFEGENFDKTGMVVKANYRSKTNPSEVLDSASYSIVSGTNLKIGQTSVTIKYEDQTINQPIQVKEKNVAKLEIKTPPTNTNYIAGENFDKTGMVVEATYENGETKIITDYTVENGDNLKGEQTYVTISYGGKTVNQSITVTVLKLNEIKITKAPDKIKYVVGQNFDKTGMVVTGYYEGNITREITDYTVENGTNLEKGQALVTIKYNGMAVTQSIIVEEKAITSISIENLPSKVQYIQNKEKLDLQGGYIKVTYNDETTEKVAMTSNDVTVTGFDNTKVGKLTLNVEYQGNNTGFEVEIVEEKASNSNLENAKCNVTRVQAYYYTNKQNEEYMLINTEIGDISRNSENDSVEYYYYLSSNANENNIDKWVKISEEQNAEDKLIFTIDSRNVSNYVDISDGDIVYVYVKEVAVKGGNQTVTISKAMKLETDTNVEVFVDGVKKDDMNSGKIEDDKDSTVADKNIPQTGVTTVITIIVSMVIIGGVCFFKYYRLRDVK